MADTAQDLVKACNDQSSQSRATWLSFLLFGTFLAVTVGSTTHKQLLLEAPVALPLLGVTLPTVSFFRLAPCLFVLTHFFMLVQLYLLSRTLHAFNAALNEDQSSNSSKATLRTQLDSFSVTQLIAGEPTDWAASIFVKLSCWITLLFAPIFLLLEFQIQFLAYHDVVTTYIHRVAIVVDLLICYLLWPAILLPAGGLKAVARQAVHIVRRAIKTSWRKLGLGAATEPNDHTWTDDPTSSAYWYRLRALGRVSTMASLVGLSFVVIGFSWLVATIPDEQLETWIAGLVPDLESASVRKECGLSPKQPMRAQALSPLTCLGSSAIWGGARSTANDAHLAANGLPANWRVWWPTAVLFEGSIAEDSDEGERLKSRFAKKGHLEIAHKNQQPGNLFARNLTVAPSGDNRGQKSAADQSQKASDPATEISLSHRDLRFARLRNANLAGVDLSGADLTGADLTRANLQNAIMVNTIATGARFDEAILKGAKLNNAWLQGASLWAADLTDAILKGAYLQGAVLQEAWAVRADFSNADLRAIFIEQTDLSDANFQGAELSGASLALSNLSRVRLNCKRLKATSLIGTTLEGASLNCGTNDTTIMRTVDLRGGVDFKSSTEEAKPPPPEDRIRQQRKPPDKDDLAEAKKSWDPYLERSPDSNELQKAFVEIACKGDPEHPADPFTAAGVVHWLSRKFVTVFSKAVAAQILAENCDAAASMFCANRLRLKETAALDMGKRVELSETKFKCGDWPSTTTPPAQ